MSVWRMSLPRRSFLGGMGVAATLPAVVGAIAKKAGEPRVESTSERELAAKFPKLDPFQTGHIRHIENLAHQLDGEWAHMGTRFPYQENFEAFRYQLAYMAFALGLAHFNRLPAAPGYFRPSFDRLVQKMLHPDVWSYWRDTSGGGASSAPATAGWINPVLKDNIMFSAYVQSMSVMYNFLFDDAKYAKPGALTFEFQPQLWGADRAANFAYDQNTLNDHIYWLMVESGYIGVACEPHCVFMICNQPSILAFRLHDVLHGTHRAKEVTDGWLESWNRLGILDSKGRYNTLFDTYHKEVRDNVFGPWSDAWLGALLHMWQPDLVRKQYSEGIKRWTVEYEDGTAYVDRLKGTEESHDRALDFAFCTMWASELGDTALLDRYLKYADLHLKPSWDQGGFYYPRNDELRNEKGRYTLLSPCAGNALIPYARLNVPNGLWNLYNQPWGHEHFSEPLLTEISRNIDITRARYLPEQKKLVFSMEKRNDGHGEGRVLIANTWGEGRAAWQLALDSKVVADSASLSSTSDGLLSSRHGNAQEIRFTPRANMNFVMSWS